MDFEGKSVVITGGATGIGFALAKRIGAAGARIILFEPRADKLAEAVAALGALGIEALSVAGDVTDAVAVEALADFARDQHGRADAIIANAGVGGVRTEILDTDDAAARALIEVNFWGVWNCTRTFGRRFRASRSSGRKTTAACWRARGRSRARPARLRLSARTAASA